MIKYDVEFVLGEELEVLGTNYNTLEEAHRAGRKLLWDIKAQGRFKDLACIYINALHYKNGKLVDKIEDEYIYVW